MPQTTPQKRFPDPSACMLYAVAAVLLLVYLVTDLASRLSWIAAVSPVLRLTLLGLVCLSAFLGARLPRQGEAAMSEGCRVRLRRVLWLCFALYGHLILMFTLFDPRLGRDFWSILSATAEDRAFYMQWYVNAKPFETIRTIYIDGYRNGYITMRYLLLNMAGNIFAFVPLSFFLPRLCRRIDRWWKFLPLTVAIVAAVELCQLGLMCGSCDVDDLILNVGGALTAYGVLRIPPVRRGVAWLICEI